MICLICKSEMSYFFAKNYDEQPFKEMMKDIGEVIYCKCQNCGFTMSKTHSELDEVAWEGLNYKFHHYLENTETEINQPPYLEQGLLLKVLSKHKIIDTGSVLDYAGGYGSLSKVLKTYFEINLPIYDPYIQDNSDVEYVEKNNLKTYKTVINSALFEHLLTRESFDAINSLVAESEGAMMIHTLVCENLPKDPNWFYLEPPVHTTFHTNKSMQLLMKQWGYDASIYCFSAKSWILLKDASLETKNKVELINKELQTEYLIYKEGFVDYWKGFDN